jgi:hypothetical protein
VITRLSVDRLTASVIPKVIDACTCLEPEEKFAWDPSSSASPLYNPIDGGHQTRPSLKQSSERAFLWPASRADSRPGISTGGQHQHANVKSYPAQVARPRLAMPELPFYKIASSHALWTGYGPDAMQTSKAMHSALDCSESELKLINDQGEEKRPSSTSLTSEWNTFMQSGLDI